MIEIGKYQELRVNRLVDFGAYIGVSGEKEEILLPGRYLTEEMVPGSMVRVFVYKDSEDRPVATTEKPYATVGEFAYLSVKDVNDTGAFLDWGLTAKDLLVPYSEQRSRMRRGGIYLVYVYLDKTTGRIAASAKIEKFLGNVYPDYKVGQEVSALVIEHTDIGYKAIVNNLHRGMIYSNEIFRPVELENTVKAFVKQVREDGKIDLTLSDRADRRTAELADRILEYLGRDDAMPLSDKMSPEHIEMLFNSSKKDFKKAVGHLYKEHKVAMTEDRRIVKA
ncbi:MAG: GntR family transcriptional regulator [Muribaculaceae bacterium]|nr:GntR family transcriptional regulator [Muribaculaceae bacterium]